MTQNRHPDQRHAARAHPRGYGWGVLGRIRRWIARALAIAVTVVTLGRLSVEREGVAAAAEDTKERPEIARPLN
ncbi:MAG: hypothetical protein SangKO_012010 [Sandaracinaceae bacterium]